MQMFYSARLKLTLFYVFVIFLISSVFSVAIYRVLSHELDRGLRLQRLRIERPERVLNPDITLFLYPADTQILKDELTRIRLNLILIDAAIVLVSGIAGYFLAGRTLVPIEEMVDEQKRFIADASHELRTPLTVLKTESEVALRDTKLDLSQAKNQIKSNLEEVAKLQSLSDHLLTLSRYEDTRLSLDMRKIKLLEILEKAKGNVLPLARKKRIQIKIESTQIEVSAEEVSLIELFTIFMDNAVKYSPLGSIVLVKVKTEGKKVTVQIKDNGIGIKASDLPYIFNRFYRADMSREKNKVGGYGLGLPIAKSIVEYYHGKIDVISSPRKGTIFIVSLPL